MTVGFRSALYQANFENLTQNKWTNIFATAFKYFSCLLQIETGLPEIETGLPEIEADLLEIEIRPILKI